MAQTLCWIVLDFTVIILLKRKIIYRTVKIPHPVYFLIFPHISHPVAVCVT
ncbi:hypothetical protein EXN66_Car013988 [Channa argus]|uniref:Uncharacterized protein n=1 Tax=Channa argus TaxID=215402 RepID=A0A6G1Q720_CHAAH|nr:hypothetical protein EXN66_Car013988 [Channa argus]